MRILLFLHSTGHLAIQPLLGSGETYASILRLLRPIPLRRWIPDERLWTLPLGPWSHHLCTVLARRGFVPSNGAALLSFLKRRLHASPPRRLLTA